jgi:hypothetical protein
MPEDLGSDRELEPGFPELMRRPANLIRAADFDEATRR